ncbi:type II secretion system protein GspG [Pseudofulvimonas gallinarii]|jgi:general secretion pathway protein G|uniref:Type II secretion system protein G (GspG) n=2 Tax=Pseudofulvimonas gallinarii TaxID=634155 RepID=A0A4S3KTH4_9GAMM|nr:type II secretion system protein GspG [Pseudofulvimonas gallinarii]TCT00370.1 type II secretion system protein G (GspG) [Pseudofulvimonas gallinarii]THD12326.1 hypothetical protein B1808_13415 [Pseudofulvimonas gallinarii]
MRHPLPRFQRAAGFSLIEMIAVLVLIGIVATLVVRNVMPGFTGGQVNAAKAQVNTVSTAVEAYYMENGRYPETLRELVGKGLKEAQLKDPWKTDIVYRRPGEGGRDFDIISYGQDGKPGGDGNNADIGNW